jgi:hypothetical protein
MICLVGFVTVAKIKLYSFVWLAAAITLLFVFFKAQPVLKTLLFSSFLTLYIFVILLNEEGYL